MFKIPELIKVMAWIWSKLKKKNKIKTYLFSEDVNKRGKIQFPVQREEPSVRFFISIDTPLWCNMIYLDSK